MTNKGVRMNTLSKASVGQPLTKFGQALFPIYLTGGITGIKGGGHLSLEISEKGSATVNTLLVANTGSETMLIPTGTVLHGGMQNRVVNTSILLNPGERCEVPVSCVQSGRWSGGNRFRPTSTVAPRSVRREMQQTTFTREDGVERADQSRVWQEVGTVLNSRRVGNSTNDLAGLIGAREVDPRRVKIETVKADGPLPGQVGIAVMHGSKVVSIEVFASTELLADQWAEVIQAIFDEPIKPPSGRPTADAVLRQLSKLSRLDWVPVPNVGQGRTSVVRNDKWSGRVLESDGQIVHASMFATAA